MIAITSLDDPRVAHYRLLADPAALRRAGLFVAEGRLVVRRLLALPRFRTRSILVTQAAFDALGDMRPPPESQIPIYLVDHAVMSGIAGFNMHRGCVALGERPRTPPLSDVDLNTARRVVVLERVNNPDNVGGIFRTAAAFGVDVVVLGPDCSDPLYRKAIRTSMAATLQVPFVDAGAWPNALMTLRAQGFRVVALTPGADARPLDEMPRDLTRIALAVGAEGDGLTSEAMAVADDRVRIRMSGVTDSLNVAVAASIACYHFSR